MGAVDVEDADAVVARWRACLILGEEWSSSFLMSHKASPLMRAVGGGPLVWRGASSRRRIDFPQKARMSSVRRENRETWSTMRVRACEAKNCGGRESDGSFAV